MSETKPTFVLVVLDDWKILIKNGETLQSDHQIKWLAFLEDELGVKIDVLHVPEDLYDEISHKGVPADILTWLGERGCSLPDGRRVVG